MQPMPRTQSLQTRNSSCLASSQGFPSQATFLLASTQGFPSKASFLLASSQASSLPISPLQFPLLFSSWLVSSVPGVMIRTSTFGSSKGTCNKPSYFATAFKKSSSPGMPGSHAIRIVSPRRSLEETRRIPSRFTMRRPCSTAKASTENSPSTSVAVVRTASAPIRSAIFLASAFAPPTCPERIGITYFPFSSMTSTALSVSLSCMKGAIARTAIPQAPTKRMGRCFAKHSPVHCFRGSSPFRH